MFDIKYLDIEIIKQWGGMIMLADLGLLILRLTLGTVFLAHGAQKAFGAFGGPGFTGATGFIGSLGFRPAR
jgi:putative oxidoreductase